jgi:hypothetical protein
MAKKKTSPRQAREVSHLRVAWPQSTNELVKSLWDEEGRVRLEVLELLAMPIDPEFRDWFILDLNALIEHLEEEGVEPHAIAQRVLFEVGPAKEHVPDPEQATCLGEAVVAKREAEMEASRVEAAMQERERARGAFRRIMARNAMLHVCGGSYRREQRTPDVVEYYYTNNGLHAVVGGTSERPPLVAAPYESDSKFVGIIQMLAFAEAVCASDPDFDKTTAFVKFKNCSVLIDGSLPPARWYERINLGKRDAFYGGNDGRPEARKGGIFQFFDAESVDYEDDDDSNGYVLSPNILRLVNKCLPLDVLQREAT